MANLAADHQKLIAYGALALVVVANVLANLLLKAGSTVAPKQAFLGLFGWQTIAGIACFAVGVFFYALALRVLPLYLAQAAAALQYVGVAIGAATLFGEQVSPLNWTGVLLVMFGVVLIAN